MKYILLAMLFALGYGCAGDSGDEKNEVLGLWKIKRIELLKETKFDRLLEAVNQYWDFGDTSGKLVIYNDRVVQNSLKVKIRNKCISSLDSATGKVTEKFYIEYLDKNSMEIASHKRMFDADYCVMYYLDKLEDSADSSNSDH